MNNRALQVTFPDGSVWHVPAEIIAESRADYYAVEVDGHKSGGPEYQAEVAYALSEDGAYDLIDWARNNMHWKGIAKHARTVKPPKPVDFREAFSDADLDVIDVKGKP
ncbi:MAG TPA: hypothetical protein DCP69_05310 [Candidatus Omnitrophica bacterium]|nr:hypothetical protein [Candidatus Omnitrophota bacterium]